MAQIMVLLSILVITTPLRRKTLCASLLDKLEQQVADTKRTDVEILCLYDNYKNSVGFKRNKLASISNGKYLIFVDDDDTVHNDYVKEILKALDNNPDCDLVVFKVLCTINGQGAIHSTFGKDLEPSSDGTYVKAKPCHVHAYKREIYEQVKFPNKNYGEDTDWSQRACKLVKKEVAIDMELYFYNYDDNVTETRAGGKDEFVK